MSIRDKIMKAAAAIEGRAILLPERWDRALVGYTITEGTRLAVGVYDYDKAVCRPFLIDFDAEDELIDALRAFDGEVKPIIIHSEVHPLFEVDEK